MLILKIRKAEVALNDGRLDDAFEQLFQPGVRDHYRGQQLISKLVPAYIQRGQKHLAEGNPAGALADYDRASQLGGNQPEIAGLRSAATIALQAETEQQQSQQQQLRHARDLMAVGANTLCQAACQSLSPQAPATAQVMAELARSQRTVAALLEPLRECLNAGNLELAIERSQSLTREQLKHRQIQEYLSELLTALVGHVRKLVADGRLEQARCTLTTAARLPQSNLELQELSSMLGHFFNSAEDVWRIDANHLLRRLKSLQQFIGKSAWIDTAALAAEQLVASLEKLKSGPLAQLESSSPLATLASVPASMPTRNPGPTTLQPGIHLGKPNLHSPFQLNIDEAGSFMVFSQSSVTLGKESRGRPVDIAFASQLDMPMMQVVRVDDDYFIYADQPVQINDRMCKDKLLSDGDRITAAGRISFRFHKPHAASNTAVLELSTSTRMATGTARRIVMMDEAIIIGSNSGSHIVVPDAEGQLILSNRNGRLEMFAQSGWNQALGAAALGKVLQPGKPVSMNSIRAVMLPVSVG
jgi:hypothetical protein